VHIKKTSAGLFGYCIKWMCIFKSHPLIKLKYL
jgi:hypothetical protein